MYVLSEMLVARIENQNGRVMEGGRIILNCEGKGYPEPTITWEKSGRALVSGGNVFISSIGGLTIRDATSSDTGTYSCIVANTDEKIETSTSVQVVPKGEFVCSMFVNVYTDFSSPEHIPGSVSSCLN